MSLKIQLGANGGRSTTTTAAAGTGKPQFTITRHTTPTTAGNDQDDTQMSTERIIVTATRGPKVIKTKSGNQTVTTTSSSQGQASFTIESNGHGRKIASKRKSGEVTTFVRTIQNDDMIDDEEKEEEGKESSAKRGRGPTALLESASKGPIQFASVPTPQLMISSIHTFQPKVAPKPAPTPVILDPLAKAVADKKAAERLARFESKPLAPAEKVSLAKPAPMTVSASPLTTAPVTAASLPILPPVPTGPTATILLRNLAPTITHRFLLSHFFSLFDIASLTLDTDPLTHVCLGTAEVVFTYEKEAQEALTLLQGQQLLGQPVKMSRIATKDSDETPEERQARIKQTEEQRARQQQLLLQQQQQQQTKTTFATPQTVSFYPQTIPSAAFASSTTAATPSFHPSPFSHPPANIGFVWDDEQDDAMNGDGEETVFNITNLKLPATTASTSTESSQPRKKSLEVRPKSVVVSGPEATAPTKRLSVVTKSGVQVEPATTSGKPIIILSKNR